MNVDIKILWQNVVSDKKLNKIIMFCSIVFFIVFSLYKVLNHVIYFDEINAWNIAAYLTPGEIFRITRREGHFFIWYFLIKPFAQNNIGYPIAMQLINWAFAFGAVLLLWFKSPFNSIVKIFITFSMPIQVLYTYARCYSLGLFLLFLICSIYKSRLRHPCIYIMLLILIANTSIMALLLAFSLGICFLFDLNQGIQKKLLTKKQIFIMLLICLFGGLLVLFQMYNYVTPYYVIAHLNDTKGFFDFYPGFENKYINILFAICHFGILAFAWDFFQKSKLPFLFLLISNWLLFIMFLSIYKPATWHLQFLYITIIIALWLYLVEYDTIENFQRTFIKLFLVMFVFLTFGTQILVQDNYEDSEYNYLKTNSKILDNKKLFLFPSDLNIIDIIYKSSNMRGEIYDGRGNSIKNLEYYIQQWNTPIVDFDEISKLLKKGEVAYIFVGHSRNYIDFPAQFNNYIKFYTKGKSDLKIKIYKYGVYTSIWEITKIR